MDPKLRSMSGALVGRDGAFRLRRLASRAGLDLHQWSSSIEVRRSRLLDRLHVDVMLDVGANTGQYVRDLRWGGYRGRVVSFEPGSLALEGLRQAAGSDPGWDVVDVAVGATDGEIELAVTQDSVFSTTKVPTPAMTGATVRTRTASYETVPLRRLDGLVKDLSLEKSRMALKIDVQGAEEDVLAGAQSSLEQVHFLELELPLVGVYEGEWDLLTALRELSDCGFRLVLTENLMPASDGIEALQINGLFVRA